MIAKVFFGLLFAVGGALAQGLPPNVRLVVPFSPGGPVDFTARVLADGMRATLGIPIVVDNRAGANGAVAAVAVKSENEHFKKIIAEKNLAGE